VRKGILVPVALIVLGCVACTERVPTTPTGPGTQTPGCSYSVSPTMVTVSAGAGTGSVSVTTGSACGWTAASNASWITVVTGSSGTGSGTVGYTVSVNTQTTSRSGTLTVAGQSVVVDQATGGVDDLVVASLAPPSGSTLRLGLSNGGILVTVTYALTTRDQAFISCFPSAQGVSGLLSQISLPIPSITKGTGTAMFRTALVDAAQPVPLPVVTDRLVCSMATDPSFAVSSVFLSRTASAIYTWTRP